MKRPSLIRYVPLAACALLGTLQAAPTPQEIFTRLAAPAQQQPMDPEKRAAALPALAYVPVDADMVVASADAGPCALELMRLLGEKPSPELQRGLSSIRSSALVAGIGGAAALEQAMPILLQSSQMVTLKESEEYWRQHANPAYADAIRKAFAKQLSLQREHVLSSYEQFRLAPVYYALTAVQGREDDFQAMHHDLLQAMRSAAQNDPDLKYEELGPFAGLRISQLSAFKWLMKHEPADPALSQAMAQRQVHLLTALNGGVAIFILCERPGDIDLPEMPQSSMLYSAKLSGADPHIDSLLATAWVGSAFSRALHACMQMDRFPLAQATVDALRNIAEQDVPNQEAYSTAVQDIIWLVWQPPYFNEIHKPFTLQIWQQGKEVYMESLSDARGMDFAPGHLQLVQQAADPQTIFYMESTAFSAPHAPSGSDYWEKFSQSVLGATKGITCTLQEQHRDSINSYIRFAELFKPELESLGSAVSTLSSALGAPFALLAAQEPSAPDKAQTDWAFFSAVRDRAGLGQGWQQALTSIGEAVGKLGIPPMLVSALPVSTKALGGSAVEYGIDLPGARAKALPEVAVSDTRFVLGNSAAFNARLIGAPNADMPFRGAVNAIDLPRLAAAMDRADCPACNNENKKKAAAFLQRLAERVQSLYTTSIIRNDTRTARGLMIMK